MFLFPVFDHLSYKPVFHLTSFFLVPFLMEPDVKGRWLAHISRRPVCFVLMTGKIHVCLFVSDCVFIYSVGEMENCVYVALARRNGRYSRV